MMSFRYARFAPILALAACSTNSELSRDDAAEKIQAHLQPEGATYTLTATGFEDGIAQGYWNRNGSLTDKGSKVFIRVDQKYILPKSSVTFNIDVTGIAEASNTPGTKEAFFTLSNDKASGPVRRFIVSGGKGKAAFRRYDDGWRLENLNLQLAPDGLPMPASEREAVAKEIAAAAEEKRALINQAFTPTTSKVLECKTLREYAKITITDVGFDLYRNTGYEFYESYDYKSFRSIQRQRYYDHDVVQLTYWNGRINGNARFFGGCDNIDEVVMAIATNAVAWQEKWKNHLEAME